MNYTRGKCGHLLFHRCVTLPKQINSICIRRGVPSTAPVAAGLACRIDSL
jgi:hypothetical protein